MRRSQVLAGAVVLLLLAGAGVAATGGNDHRLGQGRTSADPAFSSASDSGGSVSDATAGSGASLVGQPALPPSPARVVKTASLTVKVAKAGSVTAAAQRANSVAEGLGGFVASTQTRSGDDPSSTLTLRVPVANYDAALRELRRLGTVADETLGGQDVSATLVDLDARLRSLRAQESALNTLMAKARTVGETLQVAQAVAEVRTQIEQLAAQQKNLADQADFATITLSVVGPGGAVGAPTPDPVLVRALERAVSGSLDVVGGAIVVLGYAVPAALLAAAGYGVARLRRRRVAAVA